MKDKLAVDCTQEEILERIFPNQPTAKEILDDLNKQEETKDGI